MNHYVNRNEEVVFMQLESRTSLKFMEELLNSGIQGCLKVKDLIQEAIKEHHLATEIIN